MQDTSNSVLLSVKKMLGLTPEYTYFDPDILIHINSIFAILNQLGVGPESGFRVEDQEGKWSDFLPNDNTLEFVKTYMQIKVKLLFDPPMQLSVIEALNKQADELQCRMLYAVEFKESLKKENIQNE